MPQHGWRTEVRRYNGHVKGRGKDARLKKQAAANLRPRAAGSQDESPRGAIHNVKCEEPAGRRRYEFNNCGGGFGSGRREAHKEYKLVGDCCATA
jgi:hypothetical protein